MDETTYNNLIKFTQNIVDSTPKVALEDDWFQFNDAIDVNIWWEEDGPIRATAYQIRADEKGYRYTDTSHVFATLDVVERANTAVVY